MRKSVFSKARHGVAGLSPWPLLRFDLVVPDYLPGDLLRRRPFREALRCGPEAPHYGPHGFRNPHLPDEGRFCITLGIGETRTSR